MSSAKKPIITFVCKDCQAEVSGPDEDSVKEVASRHSHATGHGSMNRVTKKDDD